MIRNFIIVGIISYLLGAIPFTQIFSKIFFKTDLRTSGSGNVGARNFYEVTGKKTMGIIVLLLDLLKGTLAVLVGYYFNKSFDFALYSATFAILGHNYSPFLKFKGGRGLATAAGAMLIISPLALISWIVSYFIFNFATKNVHLRSILSTVVLPVIVIISPDTYFYEFHLFNLNMFLMHSYPYFIIALTIAIILKHIDPIFEFYRNNNLK
jgi:glycerol-3-phosphate acyltransferase PlsY